MKQNQIKLAVFESHLKKTALAWLCVTVPAAGSKHQHKPGEGARTATPFAPRLP